MSFNKNLQKLRQQKNISQEQLAEQLNVSRQSISAWESGKSSPDSDKLPQISALFGVSIDELIGELAPLSEDRLTKQVYDKFIKKFKIAIASGVSLIIFGAALSTYASGLDQDTINISSIVLITFIAISVPIFIYFGTLWSDMNKQIEDDNIDIEQFYSKKEIRAINNRSNLGLIYGVMSIFLGLITMLIAEHQHVTNNISSAIFMIFVAIATWLIIFFGIEKSKTKRIEKTNNIANNRKIEKINSVIMLIALAIFLSAGLVFKLWNISWVVFPIGGILCAISNTILSNK